MGKAAALGLQFRDTFLEDPQSPAAPIADSYHDFGFGLVHFLVPRFYRPIGSDPDVGTSDTTERINETIDGSVFERWRGNTDYRPPNLEDWAGRRVADPAALTGARLATDPSVVVP